MMTALNADTLSVVPAPYPPRPEHNGGSGSRVVNLDQVITKLQETESD